MGKPATTPISTPPAALSEWEEIRDRTAHIVIVDHPGGRHSAVGPFVSPDAGHDWADAAYARANAQEILILGMGVHSLHHQDGDPIPGEVIARVDALHAEMADIFGAPEITGPQPVTLSTAHVVLIEWEDEARSTVGPFCTPEEAIVWGDAAQAAAERGETPIAGLALVAVFTADGVPLFGHPYMATLDAVLDQQ